MSDQVPEIDWFASDYTHLRGVLGDALPPGSLIAHTERVAVVRCDTERNLWGVAVDGEVSTTFDADKMPTTNQLSSYLDKFGETDPEEKNSERREDPDSDSWTGAFQ